MEEKDKPAESEKKETHKFSSNLMSKQWHHIPVLAIGIIGFGIIVASLAGLTLHFSNNSMNEGDENSISVDTTYEETGLTYKQFAEKMAYYGNYDEAQSVLDEGIEKSKASTEAQGEFYSKKTYIALNASEFEDALVFAEKTENLLGTVQSATLVAQAAEAQGDNLKALDHWILAAERTPDEERIPDSISGDYGYVLFRIKELGGVYEP